MTLLHLLPRLFGLTSLAILGASGYLLWSWIDLQDEVRTSLGEDPQNWRLWTAAALLAWALLGRFVV
ncbi:MAG TPA: hypothetical protein VIO94_06155, partial [Phenylobacterium sp.]